MTTADTRSSRSHRDSRSARGGLIRCTLLAVGLGLAILAGASCARSGTEDPGEVVRLTIRPRLFGFLVGSQEQFRAYQVTASGDDTLLPEAAGSFVSRRPDVFTVTSHGLASAVGTGEGWLVAEFLVRDRVLSDSLKLTIRSW